MEAARIVEPGVDMAEEVEGGGRGGAGIDFERDNAESSRDDDARKRILWGSGEGEKGQEPEN